MLSQYTGFCKLVVSLQMQNRKASDKINVDRSVWYASLDPRPSDLCILMEGLVRDDHVG